MFKFKSVENIDNLTTEEREEASNQYNEMSMYDEVSSLNELLGDFGDADTGYFTNLFIEYLSSKYTLHINTIKENENVSEDENMPVKDVDYDIVSTEIYEKIADIYSNSSIVDKLKELPY